MGDMSEMMQDGTLCYSCGAYIESAAPDHPRECSDCLKERRDDATRGLLDQPRKK